MTLLVPGPDIRRSRKAQRITQAELAQEMGVTQAAVSQWENQHTPMPWHRYFEAVAAIERIVSERDREAKAARERAISATQGAGDE